MKRTVPEASVHEHRVGPRAAAEEADALEQVAVGHAGRDEDDALAARQIVGAVHAVVVVDAHRPRTLASASLRDRSARGSRRRGTAAPPRRGRPPGAPPMPITAWTPVPATATEIAAVTSPSSMSLMRAPACRSSRDELGVARAVEHDDGQVAHIAVEAVGDDLQVLARPGGRDSTLSGRRRTDDSFSMYVSGACSSPPGSETAIDASAFGVPFATRFVPSSGSTAMSTVGAVTRGPPDLLADVEHRRLVALALADDDRAVDRQAVQRLAHRLDRGAGRRRSLSPWPIQCAAAIAPASTTLSTSSARTRSTSRELSVAPLSSPVLIITRKIPARPLRARPGRELGVPTPELFDARLSSRWRCSGRRAPGPAPSAPARTARAPRSRSS